ncbi:hypothetical protein MCUN1_003473 [Malassezia cuniculi]|uniref:ENTH domain-containing protein n=1 Tax=Malassezia cuniculi TaxID=948313 RepID=A0AAF0EX22_9BASI|nr:hypothetical protein MCUN1_003473 [Malassezia cuniculi]
MSLQNLSKSAVRVGKNYLKGYTDTQIKVREATSNDPWGPSGAQMAELAQLSYNQTDFVEIMEILDKRLNDKGKNWRHVFKALTVLDYLLHSGSQNVWMYFHDNIYIVKTLKEFQYVDDSDRDQGLNVRQKAKEITALLLDESRMRDLRKKRGDRQREQREQGDYSDDIGRRRRADAEREAEDRELQKALEESRRMAEEDEARKKANMANDDELARALELSREEEEERRKAAAREAAKKDSLIDLDGSSDPNPGYGVQPQFTGFNPYLQFQPTGYNPFFQVQMQQQELMQQQYMQQEYQRQLQMQQQAAAQQYQQQLMSMQQPLQPQPTSFGSNNPWLSQTFSPSAPAAAPAPAPEQTQAPAPTQTPGTAAVDTLISFDDPEPQQPAAAPAAPSGPPRVKTSNAYPELDRLLASGDGIDTFGNTGEMRMGHNAQAWASLKQQRTGASGANPFFQ